MMLSCIVVMVAALPAVPPEENPLAAARAALGRGDVALAESLLAALGNDADAALGDLLRAAGRPAAALPYYRRALRRHRDDDRAATGLGRSLIDLGRPAEAAAVLREAATGGGAESRWAFGLALVRAGDVPAGLATLRLVRDERAGEYSESAGELYDYFIERHRPHLEAAAAAGEAARTRGDWAEAAELLLGYAFAVGDAPQAAVAGARAALAGGDPELAQRGFAIALAARPEPRLRAQALAGSGAARLQLEDAAGAERDFAAALSAVPDDPESLFGSALALARLGRPVEAADRLSKALAAAEAGLRDDLLRAARAEAAFAGRRADARLRAVVAPR